MIYESKYTPLYFTCKEVNYLKKENILSFKRLQNMFLILFHLFSHLFFLFHRNDVLNIKKRANVYKRPP